MSFTMFCGVITSELEYFEMPVMPWNLSNKSSIGTPSSKSHFLLNISKLGFKTAGKGKRIALIDGDRGNDDERRDDRVYQRH